MLSKDNCCCCSSFIILETHLSPSSCKNVNYARRTHCHRCKLERAKDAKSTRKLGTEIGKQAANKSKGLFSADDWQCTQCANVNWSRRQTCNMCNAPKIHDVEERTGKGFCYFSIDLVSFSYYAICLILQALAEDITSDRT